MFKGVNKKAGVAFGAVALLWLACSVPASAFADVTSSVGDSADFISTPSTASSGRYVTFPAGQSGPQIQVQGAPMTVEATANNLWEYSGSDVSADSDNSEYSSDQYVISIPTKVSFSGFNIGPVSASAPYTVKATGKLSDGKGLELSASDGTLADGKGNTLAYTLAGTAKKFSNAELLGGVGADAFNPDGGLKGTSKTETVSISGTALSASPYTGTVTYTSAVVDE